MSAPAQKPEIKPEKVNRKARRAPAAGAPRANVIETVLRIAEDAKTDTDSPDLGPLSNEERRRIIFG